MKDTFETGYAPIGELKMYYEIHGNGGIPLVLIHGGGSTIRTTFGNILDLFSKSRKVIAVELQGHGHTADIDRPFTFEQDADDVVALLKFLKTDKADILGFSNGGNTTMQIGIRHPEIVNKLVIISSFYKREGFFPGFFDMMENASLKNMPEQLKAAFLKIDPDSSHLQAMHDKDASRMVHFEDWPDEDLKSILAPTLLISADKDVVLPEHAVAMSYVFLNARLMILPGTHGSFLGEVCTYVKGSKMPELTATAVIEFLDTD
ncbi:MAG TPA: alpha/beta hydrolase [Saprospiraceae bacterium]|nr:alpha/beta hydrolase [Saprospiraceae bacterium]